MKRKITSAIVCAVIVFVTALFPCAVSAGEDIFSFFRSEYQTQDNASLCTKLCETAGESTSDWIVIALASMGEQCNLTEYGNAASRVCKESNANAVEKLRTALAMCACGMEAEASLIAEENGGKMGVMSFIYKLIIDDATGKSDADASVKNLLSLQKSDGGWALSDSSAADTDVTAMAVCSLALHTKRSDVDEAIDSALTLLSQRQTENGGYISWGTENPETPSQVIIALRSLGIDVNNDARFIKNGKTLYDAVKRFRCDDGGYSHTIGGKSSRVSSVQVLLAELVLKKDDGRLYSFPKAEPDATDVSELPHEESHEETLPLDESKNAMSRNMIIALCVLLVVIVVGVILKIAKKLTKIALTVLLIALLSGLIVAFTVDFKTNDEYNSAPTEEIFDFEVSITLDYGNASTLPEITKNVGVKSGENVLDILRRFAKSNGITIDASGGYVRGINGVYEAAISPTSGWVYSVNGTSPMMSSESYVLHMGDTVIWEYVESLGG